MSQVTEPYYKVVYRDYNGDIKEAKVEADNIYVSKDFEKVSFNDQGVTIRVMSGVLDCERFPKLSEE